MRLSICETAVCYDKISTTIGKSFLADYYYTRNAIDLFIQIQEEQSKRCHLFCISSGLQKKISQRPARVGQKVFTRE